MYGFGYPIGQTALLGAFSKIQKSGPQATLLSWFATAGSLARILLPIGSGLIDNAIDNGPFNIVLLMLSISYLFIILLIPLINKYILNNNNINNNNNNINNNENIEIFTNRSMNEWLQFIICIIIAIFSIISLKILSPYHHMQ